MRNKFTTSEYPDLPINAFRRSLGKNRPETLEGGGGKGGGGDSAPQYPNPWEVASATTQSNNATSEFNKALNLNNYSNPFGSQQTQVVALDPKTGAPVYNTNISANPQLQNAMNSLLGQVGNSGAQNAQASQWTTDLLGRYNNMNQSLAGMNGQYSDLSNKVGGLAGQLNQGQAAAARQQGQDAAYKAQTQYLDPQFSQQGESLSANLANQGLSPGSEAYNNSMTNFNNQKQQAYSNAQNQAIMTGSQIGAQDLQNQISGINTQSGLYGQQAGLLGGQAGLLGQQAANMGQQGGLVNQYAGYGQLPYSNLQSIASMVPGYSGTGQSSSSAPDIANLFNNQYQSQLAGYNAGQSSNNSMMGGLFGLGAGALGGMMGGGGGGKFSDRRLKRNIKRIGVFPNGLAIYSYRYMWEKKKVRHIGFMADEVKNLSPQAVERGANGFYTVDYQAAA